VNLLAEDGVHIQMYSRNTGKRPILKVKGSKKSGSRISQSLINAIIYGPEELCEPVGEYLTKCGIFLQDPVQNDRDVVYRNPHILSRSEEVVLISELTIETSDSQAKGLDNPQDLFSGLSKDDHLSLTEAPRSVYTELYP
jgi:SWI/SNF-related matrix-associated actin-dependent regulator of chromatin subfamily A3